MTRVMVIAVALVLLGSAAAGAAPTGEVRGGPRIGFSMANWYGSDSDKLAEVMSLALEYEGFEACNFGKETRLGFAIGGFLRYDVNPMFALQPEITYALKGVKYSGGCYYEGYRVDIDYTIKTNYFEIPVLGVVKLGSPTQINLNLLFGSLDGRGPKEG